MFFKRVMSVLLTALITIFSTSVFTINSFAASTSKLMGINRNIKCTDCDECNNDCKESVTCYDCEDCNECKDYKELCDKVRRMNINELTLSVKFVTSSENSNNVIADAVDIEFCKDVIKNLESDGTINNVDIIFDPYICLENGENIAPDFNPSDQKVFLDNYEAKLIETLNDIDYKFHAVYANSKMDRLIDNVDDWKSIYESVRKVQPDAVIMAKFNHWDSDKNTPGNLSVEEISKHDYFKIWDVLSVAAYFEIDDNLITSEDDIYNWLVNGSGDNNSNSIANQIGKIAKAHDKDIFIGELGFAEKRNQFEDEIVSLQPLNYDAGAEKGNLYRAYYRALNNMEWFYGISVNLDCEDPVICETVVEKIAKELDSSLSQSAKEELLFRKAIVELSL